MNDEDSFLAFKKENGFVMNAIMLIFWPLWWMKLVLVTMHIYLMSLNMSIMITGIAISIILVMVVYILTNIAFYTTLSVPEVSRDI